MMENPQSRRFELIERRGRQMNKAHRQSTFYASTASSESTRESLRQLRDHFDSFCWTQQRDSLDSVSSTKSPTWQPEYVGKTIDHQPPYLSVVIPQSKITNHAPTVTVKTPKTNQVDLTPIKTGRLVHDWLMDAYPEVENDAVSPTSFVMQEYTVIEDKPGQRRTSRSRTRVMLAQSTKSGDVSPISPVSSTVPALPRINSSEQDKFLEGDFPWSQGRHLESSHMMWGTPYESPRSQTFAAVSKYNVKAQNLLNEAGSPIAKPPAYFSAKPPSAPPSVPAPTPSLTAKQIEVKKAHKPRDILLDRELPVVPGTPPIPGRSAARVLSGTDLKNLTLSTILSGGSESSNDGAVAHESARTSPIAQRMLSLDACIPEPLFQGPTSPSARSHNSNPQYDATESSPSLTNSTTATGISEPLDHHAGRRPPHPTPATRSGADSTIGQYSPPIEVVPRLDAPVSPVWEEDEGTLTNYGSVSTYHVRTDFPLIAPPTTAAEPSPNRQAPPPPAVEEAQHHDEHTAAPVVAPPITYPHHSNPLSSHPPNPDTFKPNQIFAYPTVAYSVEISGPKGPASAKRSLSSASRYRLRLGHKKSRQPSALEDPFAPTSYIPNVGNNVDTGITYLPRCTNSYAGLCKGAWRMQTFQTKRLFTPPTPPSKNDPKPKPDPTVAPVLTLSCRKCNLIVPAIGWAGKGIKTREVGFGYLVVDASTALSTPYAPNLLYTNAFLFKCHLDIDRKTNANVNANPLTSATSSSLAPKHGVNQSQEFSISSSQRSPYPPPSPASAQFGHRHIPSVTSSQPSPTHPSIEGESDLRGPFGCIFCASGTLPPPPSLQADVEGFGTSTPVFSSGVALMSHIAHVHAGAVCAPSSEHDSGTTDEQAKRDLDVLARKLESRFLFRRGVPDKQERGWDLAFL